MKVTLCDIDNCREDSHGNSVSLQYYGTAGVFHQRGYQPAEAKIVLEKPYTHAENTSEVPMILERPFDLCFAHQLELVQGARIKNHWSSVDRNPQDEHFVMIKMKRDRSEE